MSWHVDVALTLGTLALEVELAGEAGPIALIGPNGAGKTTLLRTIAGAHRPDAGRIVVDDRVLVDTASGIAMPPERRRIGYVPQGYGLFPHLDVLENVAFGPGPAGPRRERARQVLAELRCAELAPMRIGALSGGQRQRVALARALCGEPTWLLLDEPMASLDASARRRLRPWLAADLAARAVPSWFVTHDVRDVRALGAEVVVLERGRVVQRGDVKTLADSPATDFVADFLGA